MESAARFHISTPPGAAMDAVQRDATLMFQLVLSTKHRSVQSFPESSPVR